MKKISERKKVILYFLLLILLSISTITSYNFFYLQPRFHNFIIKEFENEALRIGFHLTQIHNKEKVPYPYILHIFKYKLLFKKLFFYFLY